MEDHFSLLSFATINKTCTFDILVEIGVLLSRGVVQFACLPGYMLEQLKWSRRVHIVLSKFKLPELPGHNMSCHVSFLPSALASPFLRPVCVADSKIFLEVLP